MNVLDESDGYYHQKITNVEEIDVAGMALLGSVNFDITPDNITGTSPIAEVDVEVKWMPDQLETVKDYNLYEDAITTKTAKSSFDPRTRPWYYEAKEKETQIWTDLYMFYTGNRPGITASFPFYDQNTILQGVFGVDLELSAISEFLSLQKQYYESKILILNYKNEIVAQSGDIVFKTAEDGQVTPLHINQHSDNLIKQAYQQLLTLNEQDPKQSKQVKLVYQNELYLISAVNFPAFFGKNWKVMTKKMFLKMISSRLM